MTAEAANVSERAVRCVKNIYQGRDGDLNSEKGQGRRRSKVIREMWIPCTKRVQRNLERSLRWISPWGPRTRLWRCLGLDQPLCSMTFLLAQRSGGLDDLDTARVAWHQWELQPNYGETVLRRDSCHQRQWRWVKHIREWDPNSLFKHFPGNLFTPSLVDLLTGPTWPWFCCTRSTWLTGEVAQWCQQPHDLHAIVWWHHSFLPAPLWRWAGFVCFDWDWINHHQRTAFVPTTFMQSPDLSVNPCSSSQTLSARS